MELQSKIAREAAIRKETEELKEKEEELKEKYPKVKIQCENDIYNVIACGKNLYR